ncbi:ATP-dependent helicase [Polymorphobacter fuscus]|uniref:DNA 3'-5' helicase n=1 Tax=Sandarakinorhabdus fusca TaxID=1439888 RepID=A0A7C9GQA8_9SPHN|nr:UvrD-helicase domain-containing protein [Polymorphobacter fuscus]KAB7644355.1 AAA family ATPase [Polymorphobacter fuscus]MQT18272.1 AAA family ATPase [Polymorphobacter fuscus]NJC08166.1 DNA helicase-2/ATP-dependent DNA helicase PcrA [Polymorphobacter fuscus]
MASSPALTSPAWLDGLNPPQRQAVLTTEGPVLILAGAGTGKTRALTARLAHILYSRLAWPSEVLAVTFTNKAAREMRHRMEMLVGEMAEGMPFLGTFHAIAARMLRRHAGLVGLDANFTILDTDDQLRLLKQVVAEAGLEEKRWPAKQLAGMIDRWKNRGELPTDVPPGESLSFGDGTPGTAGATLYARYQQRLAALNAADFGDLLLHMLTIFDQHPDVLAEWRKRFKYILVDEYQDTNSAQYRWLTLLAADRRNIACVGDDDQSIYSWRGAEVANILRFEKDFPGATVIKLEQNYRSTAPILAAANGLIAHNKGRIGKALFTGDTSAGEPIKVIGVWDGPEEARLVGDKAEQLARDGSSLNDMAILVRAQFQTRAFEDRFVSIGLPYKIVGGFRFYERAEIRDALAYLRIVASPNDALAFERIVNVPKRGLGDKAMGALHAQARRMDRPLPQAAASLVDTDELTPAARRSLKAFLADLARWREQAADLPHAELARVILEESGYVAMWQADKSVEADGRLENLIELTRAMADYPSLTAFLEHVSLVMDNDANDASEKLTIMTLHAAKGLEFDHVFLVGWEEGVFPSQRAMDEGGTKALEEERRLAYVGITRARRSATIIHAANRQIYGQWTAAIPSRFISEIPPAHVDVSSTMSGGPSLWRAALANSGAGGDPFGDVQRGTGRGPGWARAAQHGGFARDAGGGRLAANRTPAIEVRASAVSVGLKGRSDVAVGARVFHTKFGNGTVTAIDGNKLEIDFEHAGAKRVLDSFIEIVG